MKTLTHLLALLAISLTISATANAQYLNNSGQPSYQPVVYSHFGNPGNEFTQGAITGNIYTTNVAIQETARQNVFPQSGQTNEPVSIFPNPAITATNITLSQPASNSVTLDVYDLNGTLQFRYRYNAGVQTLGVDVSSLRQGLYSLEIREAGKRVEHLRLEKTLQ